jgi:hypothetical protein
MLFNFEMQNAIELSARRSSVLPLGTRYDISARIIRASSLTFFFERSICERGILEACDGRVAVRRMSNTTVDWL